MAEQDDGLDPLRRKAADLRKRLELEKLQLLDVSRRVQEHERMLYAYELVLQLEAPEDPTGQAARPLPEPSGHSSEGRVTITNAVRAVLLERGAPMHASEVMDELRRRGIALSAKDPKATVVTALVRGTRRGYFDRVGPNTFALRNVAAKSVER